MLNLYALPSRAGTNSYSVFDHERQNEWGEDWCVLALVTFEQAVDCCKHPAKYDEHYIGLVPSSELTMDQIAEWCHTHPLALDQNPDPYGD